jgi:site-specific DNA-adenine methylase
MIPAPFKRYNGGKSGNGTYQTIINLLPPMVRFVSPFVGNGGVERRLRLPQQVILNDSNDHVINQWENTIGKNQQFRSVTLKNVDGLELIKQYAKDDTSTLIYCDPPYLFESRVSQKNLYKHEWEYDDHVNFLNLALTCKCNVVISHPPHILYENMLQSWNVHDYQSMTSSGKKMWDRVWYNYLPPFVLQDYRYLGSTYRQREIIKNKTQRHLQKLEQLPLTHLQGILSATIQKYGERSAELIKQYESK